MVIKGQATVVKHTGSHYMLSALPQWELFPAVLRGKIRLKDSNATNPVAVGDVVDYEAEIPDGAALESICEHVALENPAAITGIHKRRNYVIRKSTNLSRQSHIIAANLDRAFLVVTIDFPQVKLPFLDRLLVTCEVYNVPPVIVLNKCDLYGPEHEEMLAAFHEIYQGAGYPIIDVSAHSGQGIDLLRDVVFGKRNPDGSLNEDYDSSRPAVSLFSGVSGVGKSSLIKALDPSLEPRVGDISTAHEQGRHTTTFYEMYRVQSCHPESSICHPESSICHPERSEGSVGFIVDTPGLRGFGLVDLKKEEIALYFPEMLEAAQNCRFTPCTHTHEPGCAVKEAVEEGLISYDRYSSYLGMLDEEGKYR